MFNLQAIMQLFRINGTTGKAEMMSTNGWINFNHINQAINTQHSGHF